MTQNDKIKALITELERMVREVDPKDRTELGIAFIAQNRILTQVNEKLKKIVEE